MEEVGDAIGILRGGILLLDSMDMSNVLMDRCLYDWFEDGKNLVQRYAEAHPADPQTDEGYILQASLQASYRLLVFQSAVPGAGIYCRDVLGMEELFLMDIGLSRSVMDADAALATRTIPLGEYWMTGGAALPIPSKDAALDTLNQIERAAPRWSRTPGAMALSMVRACLAAGAADHVAYAPVTPKRKEPRWQPRRRRRS
jgi:hypothetical protein